MRAWDPYKFIALYRPSEPPPQHSHSPADPNTSGNAMPTSLILQLPEGLARIDLFVYIAEDTDYCLFFYQRVNDGIIRHT